MSIPVLIGLLAVVLIVVAGVSMRGGTRVDGTGERPTAAGQQSGVIVLVLVVAAGLILYFLFGR